MDAYFSADIETDGPIPGPYSILSFALVYAGSYDGKNFNRPKEYNHTFYRELKPIADNFQQEALSINGLDRDKLIREGTFPALAMQEAHDWIKEIAGFANPVFVAYPLSFDWTWLYWYFIQYCKAGSPFGYSQCFDIKTAISVKLNLEISQASKSKIPKELLAKTQHTHHALDDAIEQAEMFANIFNWGNK